MDIKERIRKPEGIKRPRSVFYGTVVLAAILSLSACGQKREEEGETLTIAAAASLEECLTEELIPLFEEKNEGITVQGSYDSSGRLQTQIEEGAEVDLFFSAAEKQMDALVEAGMVDEDTVAGLLENNIVLIVPVDDIGKYKNFEDIVNAAVIAVGDPESVPAGQYAQEALTYLGLWEQVLAKASLGSNVTEVLNWVAEGSAGAGIVYKTDAVRTEKVAVIAQAPPDSVNNAVYPAGILKNTAHRESAEKFLSFLESEEAAAVFESHGFAVHQ